MNISLQKKHPLLIFCIAACDSFVRLSTLLKISKNAGPLLKPHIAVLVTALLEAVSGLEPQVMNYFSLRIAGSEEAQERVSVQL